jgi:hypothetical protein
LKDAVVVSKVVVVQALRAFHGWDVEVKDPVFVVLHCFHEAIRYKDGHIELGERTLLCFGLDE